MANEYTSPFCEAGLPGIIVKGNNSGAIHKNSTKTQFYFKIFADCENIIIFKRSLSLYVESGLNIVSRHLFLFVNWSPFIFYFFIPFTCSNFSFLFPYFQPIFRQIFPNKCLFSLLLNNKWTISAILSLFF